MAALHTLSTIAVILIIIHAAKCIDVNITGAGVVRGMITFHYKHS